MYIYYFLILLIYILGIIAYNNKKLSSYYFIYIFFILFLISAFRSTNVGGDLYRYFPTFIEISKTSFKDILTTYTKFGIIFTLYIKLLYFFSSDPVWILFNLSFINIFIPLLFFYKYSKILWLSILLYICFGYYTNTFNSLRSSVSLSISMIAFFYLLKNKNYKAIIFFLIALEIHKTIFPLILMFFIINKKPTFIKILLPILICFTLTKIIGLTGISGIINMYNEINSYGQSEISVSNKGYNLLIYYIILTLLSYLFLRNKLNKLNRFLIWAMCIATCLQCFSSLYSLITRIALFLAIYQIILIPNIIKLRIENKFKPLAIIFVSVYGILFFNINIMTKRINYNNSNPQGTIPYEFYFESHAKNF